MDEWGRNIDTFLSRHPECLPRKTSKGWELRCVICGDSQKRKFLRRGAFLKRDNTYIYTCANDGCEANVRALPVHGMYGFFATHFPEFYQEANHSAFATKKENIDYKSLVVQKKEEPKAMTKDDERREYANFISLKKPSALRDKAIRYCESRYLMEDVWKDFFVAVDGKYKDRLIIPFRDSQNKIVFFQGRTLSNSQVKYKNREGRKQAFRIDQADPSRTVFAFEGVMDCFHVNNSIAFLGLGDHGMIAEIVERFPKLCFVLDDDKAGIPIAKKFIESEKNVFLWEQFKHDFGVPDDEKLDMNKFVCEHLKRPHVFEPEELEKYISKGYWDRFWI